MRGEHAHAGIEKIAWKLFDAAVVENAETTVAAKEKIARVNIGVKCVDAALDLVVYKIPQQLTKMVYALLPGLRSEKFIHVQAVDIAHRQHALAAQIGQPLRHQHALVVAVELRKGFYILPLLAVVRLL